jgi:hypothetical protein
MVAVLPPSLHRGRLRAADRLPHSRSPGEPRPCRRLARGHADVEASRPGPEWRRNCQPRSAAAPHGLRRSPECGHALECGFVPRGDPQ